MIGGHDWVFVENPKTGTRSAFDALTRAGAERLGPTHATLMTLQMPGDKTYKNYRIRAVVVRNPWDRMVSAWAHRCKDSGPNFGTWLENDLWEAGVGLDLLRCPQTCWSWQCTHVLRFENLQEDFASLTKELGFGELQLPHKNAHAHAHYREVHTSKTRAIVEDRFAPDIYKFRYYF